MPDLTPIEAKPAKRVKKVRVMEPMTAPQPWSIDKKVLQPVGKILSGPIFTRARDIIAANVNELVERAEDPAKMIRMIILEMEDVLAETRATAARAIADLKEMRVAKDRLVAMEHGWQEKAELALSKGREDLAKQALIERGKVSGMLAGIAHEMHGIEDVLKGYEADIQRLQGKLAEARSRQNSIASRIQSAMTRARTREMVYGERTADAFSRFEALERQADLAEGAADAAALGGESLEDQIETLRAEEAADAALADMKARLAKKKEEEGNKE